MTGKAKPANLTTKSSCSSLPKMTYKVGDKSTCCSKEAKGLMTAAPNQKMVYMVGGKEFCDEKAAYTHMVNEYERVAANYCTVAEAKACSEEKTCPLTGKKYMVKSEGAATYTVAGRNTECSKHAAQIAKAGKDAMQKVSMTYRVSGKDYCCDSMACDHAKAGATKMYVVNGQETSCEMTARMMLAKAKIEAAQKATTDL